MTERETRTQLKMNDVIMRYGWRALLGDVIGEGLTKPE